MREMLVVGHLGLGDGILLNALVRHLAQNHAVTFLCKPHNSSSLAFQWRDELGITLIEVENDDEARSIMHHIRGHNRKVLGLGVFGEPPFNPQFWDKEMYRQAGVPFQMRWNGFKVHRQPSMEIQAPQEPFAFVHDDPSRKFVIDPAKLPKDLKIVRPDPKQAANIYQWWDCCEKAQEIHVIDSSFAILIDSLPDLQAKVLHIHLYARPGALPPMWTKPQWEVLK